RDFHVTGVQTCALPIFLKYVETHFGELQTTDHKYEIADRFEVLANEVLKGNKDVPESNPNADEEEIMTPVMDTIKDLVGEMPEEETLEDILAGILPQPTFVKRDKERSEERRVGKDGK